MMKLRHPNVVKLVGVCWDEGLLACCLEFVENGTLEDWLRKTTWKKSRKFAQSMTFHRLVKYSEAPG